MYFQKARFSWQVLQTTFSYITLGKYELLLSTAAVKDQPSEAGPGQEKGH